jgi:oligoribonuclease (3'-5' exoribonuclease)
VSSLLTWIKINTTTGSDKPFEGNVVEIALHITNAEEPWKHRGSVEHRITPPADRDFEAFVEALNRDQRKMFEESGVLEWIKHGAHQPLSAVEEDIVDFLGNYGEPGQFILCGRQVEWMERPWLEFYFPELAKWFAPLSIDLGTMSHLIAQTGLDLEPVFEEPMLKRAHNFTERYCIEFMYYVELLRTVPLYDPSES